MSDKIERKIHFYKITSTVPDEDGYGEEVDLPTIVEKLKPFLGEEDSNFIDFGDDQLGIWLESETFPVKLKIGRIRKKSLPLRNKGINLSGLKLGTDGLVEITHMVFWKNGLVGVEYNHNAPRPSALENYLWEQVDEEVHFFKLVNEDIDNLFNEFSGFFSMNVRIKTSYISTLSNEDGGFFKALEEINQKAECDVIEIGIKNYRKKDENNFLKSKPLKWLKKISKGKDVPAVIGASINGERKDGSSTSRNLLDDLFVFTTEVVKLDGSRAIKSGDMFEKLVKVYNRNKEKLIEADRIEYYDN